MSKMRIMFNRFTPTRGGREVTLELEKLAFRHQVRVFVSREGLFTSTGWVRSSQYYAAALYRAGVREIVIEQSLSRAEIKELLDLTLDHNLPAAQIILSSRGDNLLDGTAAQVRAPFLRPAGLPKNISCPMITMDMVLDGEGFLGNLALRLGKAAKQYIGGAHNGPKDNKDDYVGDDDDNV